MDAVDWTLLVLAVVLLAERLGKHAAVVHFFSKRPPASSSPPRLVSILQPILSGDPTLPACLERNLALKCTYPLEFLWLVDEEDSAGRDVCQKLIDAHPEKNVQLVLLPAPPDRCSPKMVKLIAGSRLARGDVLCVLDDDTTLPDGGLEAGLPALDTPGVGLAFGLPYYVSFHNFWSSLVASFVNSNSLLTYVPYTYLRDPFTINGMFFAVKREVLDRVGGFDGLEPILADDFAVGQRFRAAGYKLAQTSLRHPISTRVEGARPYFSLLHRWFTFPRETLLKAMPLPDLLVVHGLALFSALAPVPLFLGLALRPSWWFAGLVASYFAYSYLMFAHFNIAYLKGATPWRWSWLVPLVQVLLPVQVLATLLSPQRIVWRGHVLQVERGGGFRFVRRRTE